MTRFWPRLCALAFLALSITALASLPAAAQDGDTAVQAEKPAPQPRTHLTAEELDALEAMSQEEQQAFFNQRRADNEELSDEQRQARREERRAAFDALPAADQVTIKERTQKLIDNLYTAPPRDLEAEQAEAEKVAKDFIRNLTPEQKAAWQEIQKNNGNWDKAKKKSRK